MEADKKAENDKPAEKTQNPAEGLKAIFMRFSSDQNEIDGKAFNKLCKDCNVLNKECNSGDVDLAF